MKKRQVLIKESKNASGVCTILINNARYQKGFYSFVRRIMEYFLIGDEVFFGFYRTDGVNLTKAQCKRLEKRIPDFFRGDGDIQNLSEYLSVARITLNDQGLDLLPQIFDYYLETIMFKPKADWATFQQYYRHYLDHRLENYILDNLAGMLFCYLDSGDFMICFDPGKNNPEEIRCIASEILAPDEGRKENREGSAC